MSDTYHAGVAATYRRLGITKEAASRIDKALAAGQLAFKDVMPGLPTPRKDTFGAVSGWKKLWRDNVHAPTPRSAEELARTRALNAAKAEQAVHNTGVRGVKVVRDNGTEHLHGHGPHVAMNQSRRGNMRAVVPASAASDARESLHLADTVMSRAPKKLTASKAPKRQAIDGTVRSTPLNAPEDSTLMHAITQHEIGEARTLKKVRGTEYAPHANHLGVEPTLRENIAVVDDPAAQEVMGRIRGMHPDDAHVQRLVRQVGGTHDSPIPLEGRRANALHRRLRATQGALSSDSRALSLAVHHKDPRGSKAQKLLPSHVMEDMAALKALQNAPRVPKKEAPRRAGQFRSMSKKIELSPSQRESQEIGSRLNAWVRGGG
jgi:hypothetical protein